MLSAYACPQGLISSSDDDESDEAGEHAVDVRASTRAKPARKAGSAKKGGKKKRGKKQKKKRCQVAGCRNKPSWPDDKCGE